ncbi:hypothetical protein BDQ12DRAFT_738876 [Crucibulum laeve]|uniref:Uncharacterized protein n=1 Tax=Crucibulum laeve TaxID=68775 RepID=A0A5C3LMT9_9AGAR|nr:hypothetical protein BDQ12DRAFT_738876 [Crucibulum laeve]
MLPITLHLPSELCLRILHLAISIPAGNKLYEVKYRPFFDIPTEDEYTLLRQCDNTCLTLALVCKGWKDLALEFLYKNVRLYHGTGYLLRSLTRDGSYYGKLVRRIDLSVDEYEYRRNPVTPADILRACRNVNVLVKNDDDLLPHSVHSVELSSLKRFDWWYARYRDGNHRFQTEGDDASRGLDFLRQVVANARNLIYLSVACRRRDVLPTTYTPQVFALPAVETLRIELIDIDLRAEIEKWTFPSLKTLIMNSYLVWMNYSPLITDLELEVLELLEDSDFFQLHCLPDLLSVTKHLRELNYYVEHVLPSEPGATTSPSLRTIGLHSKPNPILRFASWPSVSASENHAVEHFSMFSRVAFPSLERIILYDD